jgi:hypothetical protein
MSLSVNSYKKISKFFKNFSKFDIAQNYGLFTGDRKLYKTVKILEFINQTKNIKGDIIEFGTWNGNTGILISKYLKLFGIKKKIYLFDHFQGLKHFSNKDKKSSKIYNFYKGNKDRIIGLKKFFGLNNLNIIDANALDLHNDYFKKFKFSLVICDMDLYLPTIKALNSVNNSVTKNGLIVFDEGNMDEWIGEKKALNEFFKKNKNSYSKKIISKKNFQPDVILKKRK